VRLTAGGRTLTYSGDTGASDALVRLASGSDVLLCEATFEESPDLPPDLHLTGHEAGEHAAKAEVGRLLVTHIPPWAQPEGIVASAAQAFDGPTEQITPGASFDI